jgi:transposase-like protein
MSSNPTVIGAYRITDPPTFRHMVRAAMKAEGGSIPNAARSLGVSTRTLFRWLQDKAFDGLARRAEGRPAKKKDENPGSHGKPRAKRAGSELPS